jgi:hypothetical protein
VERVLLTSRDVQCNEGESASAPAGTGTHLLLCPPWKPVHNFPSSNVSVAKAYEYASLSAPASSRSAWIGCLPTASAFA